jgi:diguanylate cyclase (GGDEF)-like protein
MHAILRSMGDPLAGLRPVFDVVKKINSETDLRKLLVLILQTTIELSNAKRGALVVFGKDRDRARLACDRSGRELKPDESGVSTTVLEKIRKTGKAVLAADARNDGAVGDVRGLTGALSVLCLPLRVKEKLTGAVYLDHPGAAGAFGPREVEIAAVLVEHAAIAIHNAILYQKSIRDRLTKAATHAHFEKRLGQEVSRAKREGGKVGLIMIDVDDFKGVNDTYGHDTGNAVLKHVAKTLGESVRAADVVGRGRTPTVARYGGDEFEVILPGADRAGTLHAAERMVAELGSKKLAYGNGKLRLSISVGGAVYPDDARTAHDLQLRADEALYESKRGGKNRAVLIPSGRKS